MHICGTTRDVKVNHTTIGLTILAVETLVDGDSTSNNWKTSHLARSLENDCHHGSPFAITTQETTDCIQLVKPNKH